MLLCGSTSVFLEMITEDFPKSAIKMNFGMTGGATNKPAADSGEAIIVLDSDDDDDVSKKPASKQPTKTKSNGM